MFIKKTTIFGAPKPMPFLHRFWDHLGSHLAPFGEPFWRPSGSWRGSWTSPEALLSDCDTFWSSLRSLGLVLRPSWSLKTLRDPPGTRFWTISPPIQAGPNYSKRASKRFRPPFCTISASFLDHFGTGLWCLFCFVSR